MPQALRNALLAVALFAINLPMVWRLLGAEYIAHMDSIEGAYIGLIRYILKYWPDLAWFPLWYGGVPFQNAYPPVQQFLAVGLAKAFGLSPGVAYHAVIAILYALGPVTLFLLALKLCRSRAWAFVAGLVYSFVSPSTWLIAAVRGDAGGIWHPRRLQALVGYGEAPHILAMTFLPLAILLMVIAFERRRPFWWIAAALGLALAALTNWIGAFVLVLAVMCWMLAQAERSGWRDWVALAAMGAYAYAVASPWMPPSTIRNIQHNEMTLVAPVSPPLERWACVALCAAVFVVVLWLLRRFSAPVYLRFAVLFVIPIAWLPLAVDWASVTVVPQAKRLHLDMEMGVVLAGVFAVMRVLERSRRMIRVAAACAVLAVCVYSAIGYYPYATELEKPIDITKRVEYRQAKWLEQNATGERVFASGSVSFFMNAFADVPQLVGGFQQADINPVLPAFIFQLESGMGAGDREGEIAVVLLKAMGVGAVAANGPRSEAPYRGTLVNPRKYEGVLPEAWRDADDVIYRVPRRSASLAHVVRQQDLPSRVPLHGLDIEPIEPYVRALENPALPLAQMEWRNQHAARITADLRREQLLSVQISYHPGWHAMLEGKAVPVRGDNLGQVVIAPACAGPCRVDMYYNGGTEMHVARALSWSALVLGCGWVLMDAIRRRRRRRTAG